MREADRPGLVAKAKVTARAFNRHASFCQQSRAIMERAMLASSAKSLAGQFARQREGRAIYFPGLPTTGSRPPC